MTTESGITLPRFGHIRVGEGKGGGSSRPATQGLELCLPRGLLRAMRGDDNPCCVVGFSAGEGGTPRPRTTSAVWDYSCRPVCGRGATMVGISDGFLGGTPMTATTSTVWDYPCWHLRASAFCPPVLVSALFLAPLLEQKCITMWCPGPYLIPSYFASPCVCVCVCV